MSVSKDYQIELFHFKKAIKQYLQPAFSNDWVIRDFHKYPSLRKITLKTIKSKVPWKREMAENIIRYFLNEVFTDENTDTDLIETLQNYSYPVAFLKRVVNFDIRIIDRGNPYISFPLPLALVLLARKTRSRKVAKAFIEKIKEFAEKQYKIRKN